MIKKIFFIIFLGILVFLSTSVTAEEGQAGYYRVTAVELNVRSDPDRNGRIITTVKVGQTLFVSYFEGKWGKIDLGWVSGKYLKRVDQIKSSKDSEGHLSSNFAESKNTNKLKNSKEKPESPNPYGLLKLIIGLIIISTIGYYLYNFFIHSLIALKLAEPDGRNKMGIRSTLRGRFIRRLFIWIIVLILFYIFMAQGSSQ